MHVYRSRHRLWPFPLEIFEEIIDQIHETSELLRISLVCRRALVKCRRRLFSSIEIGKTGTNYKRLDRFLYLASAKWTSFTPVVKKIHLRDLAEHRDRNDYSYKGIKNPKLVASNLCNVKTLSISSSKRPHEFMKVVPPPILKIIFSLNIHDLQLDYVEMSQTHDVVAFFSQVPPSVKTFTFLGLNFWWESVPNLSRHLSILPSCFRFRRLDSTSLALFQHALDPLTNPGLNVTVQSFCIRSHVPDFFYQLTRRFLHHAGPSIEQLWVRFYTKHSGFPGQSVCFCIECMSSLESADESITCLGADQLMHCINLQMVYFTFCQVASRTLQMRSLVPAIWTMLSALPSPNSLQEFWIRFRPHKGLELEHQLYLLGLFGKSPNRLDKHWRMFPNLKVIKLIFTADNLHHSDLLLEQFYRVDGFGAWAETGVVKLMIINRQKIGSYDHFVLDTIGHRTL